MFDRVRLAGWLLPGLFLAAAASLVLNRNAALGTAARAEARAGSELQSARAELAAARQKPKEARYACAPRTADEETAFLLDLRRRARMCGVSIARWTSKATDYKQKEGTPDPDLAAVEGATKVACDLVVVGRYAGLRAFLADLWSSERLLTVGHIDWNRTDAGSELSMSLGRYLAPKAASSNP